jgi:hypothetical protein
MDTPDRIEIFTPRLHLALLACLFAGVVFLCCTMLWSPSMGGGAHTGYAYVGLPVCVFMFIGCTFRLLRPVPVLVVDESGITVRTLLGTAPKTMAFEDIAELVVYQRNHGHGAAETYLGFVSRENDAVTPPPAPWKYDRGDRPLGRAIAMSICQTALGDRFGEVVGLVSEITGCRVVR